MKADCPKCEMHVPIVYPLTDAEFLAAIDKDPDIRVTHRDCSENGGDYQWTLVLTDDIKASLRSQWAEEQRWRQS